MRASELPDIFTLESRLVLEMIDFRTIIERAVKRQLVLLRASDLILEASLLLPEIALAPLSIIVRKSIISNTNKPRVQIAGKSLALNKTASS